MCKIVKKSIVFLLLIVMTIPIFASCTRKKIDVSGFKTVEDFDKKDVKIGVPISSKMSVLADETFKKAKLEYFSSGPDLFAALEEGKIDALLQEDYGMYLLSSTYPFAKIVEGAKIGQTEIAYAFPKTEKGERLKKEFDEFILKLKENGKLQEMTEYWMDLGLPSDIEVDFSDLQNINGELSMYTEAQARPFAFVYYGKNVGLELALAKDFCKEHGYALNLTRTSAVLPALTSGKCDFVGSGMEIIEEKKNQIYFSEPVFACDDYVVINDHTPVEKVSFIQSVKDGFVQTFVRESRYKLFINGTITTIIISILTLVLGTVIGFALYLVYYGGLNFLAKIFHFLSWLFSRLPMVVFLMFILYIVFAKIDINGEVVAVISFTIVFATTVFSLIDTNVQNVESGQIEAASSLGYNRVLAFIKIILPQILPNVLPAYQSEILSLVKSTSIVGYVMVSDLTKVGDLVRSRTYLAFFPLIAVAIIYILLAKVIMLIVGYASRVLLNTFKLEKKIEEAKKND